MKYAYLVAILHTNFEMIIEYLGDGIRHMGGCMSLEFQGKTGKGNKGLELLACRKEMLYGMAKV